jgi:predicted RNase H-like HicB family nuclease
MFSMKSSSSGAGSYMAYPLYIPIVIERLPEGIYLATSEEIPGLTVECETPEETAAAAKDVAVDLLEMDIGHSLDPRPEFTVTYR